MFLLLLLLLGKDERPFLNNCLKVAVLKIFDSSLFKLAGLQIMKALFNIKDRKHAAAAALRDLLAGHRIRSSRFKGWSRARAAEIRQACSGTAL